MKLIWVLLLFSISAFSQDYKEKSQAVIVDTAYSVMHEKLKEYYIAQINSSAYKEYSFKRFFLPKGKG